MIKIATLAIALAACTFTGPAELDGDAGAGADVAATTDADPTTDAPAATPDGQPTPDAPAAAITLSDTPPDVATEAGAGCVSGTSGAIYDGTWWRVFPLADPHFGVPGSISIGSVSISVWKAQNANMVKLEIGTYGGTFPSGSFATSMFASARTIDVTIPNQTGGQLVPIAVSPPVVIAAGAKLAIKISASSGLTLGATASGSYATGFFGSQMCAYAPPIASAGFIVTATGTP